MVEYGVGRKAFSLCIVAKSQGMCEWTYCAASAAQNVDFPVPGVPVTRMLECDINGVFDYENVTIIKFPLK